MPNSSAAAPPQFDAIAGFALDPALAPPEAELRAAATLLIDTLGVAAGAVTLQAGRLARDFAADHHAAGAKGAAATMLFDGRHVALPGAAWALATQIDNLDAHDGLNATKGHIGCAVVPALLAFAEGVPGLSGRAALTAMVMAYEVAARAGIALHASAGDYHTSGAWNALGVAALGCRLTGADARVLRHALGIAEYHGPRSQMMREIANPTMLHDGSGQGALAGTTAALLAARGFTGAPALTVESPEVAGIWADLGQCWTVSRNYIKPWPVCRWAHAALDALNALMRAHGFGAREVAALNVNTFAEAAQLVPGMPETTSQAQYSLRFALAALLVHGRLGPDQIAGAALDDPRIAALLPRITVAETARHSAHFPQGRWSDLTVHLADGRVLESGDVNAHGGPEAPLSDAAIRDKLQVMAGATLRDDRIAAIWGMRDRLLDPAAEFAELAALITPAP